MHPQRLHGHDADLPTTGDAGSVSLLLLSAPDALRVHPWIVALDAACDPAAWAVGGVVLRSLVTGGREPRDLDVQYEGGVDGAKALQEVLRAQGVPANVRSLQEAGVRDMMTHAAGWRRVKYQAGVLVVDPLAVEFLDRRVAVVLLGLSDSALAEKSAAWVLKEYPGATIERRSP